MRFCTVESCGKVHLALGYCNTHYIRFKRHKSVLKKSCCEIPIKERILSKIYIDNVSGCWNWTGATRGRGYGSITHNKKRLKIHRVSYEAFVGEIPDNLLILHKCDNRLCCNPDHLFIGTQKDNMHDMFSKGRAKPGRKKCQTQS